MTKKSLLLLGGNSEERLVSVASAQNLIRNYPFDQIVFWSFEGSLSLITKDELLKHEKPFEVEFKPPRKAEWKNLTEALGFFKDYVVFLALHGTQGEDGTVQAQFEKVGISFTGSGSEASRKAFEKTAAKKILQAQKVLVCAELVGNFNSSSERNELTRFFQNHGKIVLKPLANGSSVGLHIISAVTELEKALSEIGKADRGLYLAEKFVSGRELTVGVIDLGRGSQKVLPPSEVVLQAGRSFDYQGKYLGRGTTEITPAQIMVDEAERAQNLALTAHRALGCFGYSRTDLIFSRDGYFYLETNTLPGLSGASFIPQQLAAAGIPLRQFVETQLHLALERNTSSSVISGRPF